MKELADELNDRGLTVKQVMKPTWDMEWTPELVKSEIVSKIAHAVAKTERTHELSTENLSKVVDVIDKNLLTKFDIDLPFTHE